jgi:spore coat protein A
MKNILGAFVAGVLALGLLSQPVFAQVGAQTPLTPTKIPQFVDPLPHFAGARVNAKAGGSLTVMAVPSNQVAVSTGTVLANGIVGVTPGAGVAHVWAYKIQYGIGAFTDPLWPAYTIEAQRDPTGAKALHMSYVNGLGGETYDKVGLIADQTLHWADPLEAMGSMNPYAGEPPLTVHLHGGEVPPQSDGGPDSWYTPSNAETGHSYNANPYLYPNTQEGATLWFHDHALGVTRLNVYAGLAGFYFLREVNEDALHLPGWSGDGKVTEVDPATGLAARGPYLPEIEIVIQDRMFDQNGGLFYPNLPPNPAIHPFWTPEFVGDVITVNGKTWPYLSVADRQYRFRLLNGSNARFYNLSFPKGGPRILQIGTDGGFLDQAIDLGNGPLLLAPGERADVIVDFSAFPPLTNKKGKQSFSSFVLTNDARTPFPGGKTASGNTTGRIMKFVVNGGKSGAAAASVATGYALRSGTGLVKLTDFAGSPANGVTVDQTRQLTLNEVMGAGGPAEVLVNNTKWSGLSLGTTIRPDFTAVQNDPEQQDPDPMMDVTYYSETMDEGSTEVWQIINLTADAHPIHLHLVQFQLMSRQPFDAKGYTAAYDAAFPTGVFLGAYGPPNDYNVANADGAIGGNPAVSPFLVAGTARPAFPNENGWKDTFIMYPGEVTTVIARWAPTDKSLTATDLNFAFNPDGGHGYVWHCHIIDHEDNEMMRPYNVTPLPGASRLTFPLPSASIAASGSVADVVETAEDAVQAPAVHVPREFGLAQNYPNPFNPTTEIRFSLPQDSHVRLALFNSLGQEVKTLIDDFAPAGYHSVRLDAGNLASGTYFYRIQAGGFVSTKKMVLVK